MECLDANAVQDLMSGTLDAAARGDAIAHLDGCADCRDLISLLAREVAGAARPAAPRAAARAADALLDTQDSDAGKPSQLGLMSTAAVGGAAGGAAAGGAAGAAIDIRPRRIESPSMTGRILGRYTLTDRLGVGAMGVVYRADDIGLGRQVALKLLHRPDEALTERLVREARSMAQVNHPHVVTVYDVGVTDGLTYIAMELVPGTSLRHWQQQPHSVAEIVAAYIAAGRGLAAAHAAGIVHRDFKPDNCLVGSDGRIRVTDFGLAAARPSASPRPASVELDESHLTASGSVLGTPAYMAPEQFTGGNVEPRTDQFNFCVALHEALYGARPFTGKSFDELGDAVAGGVVRPAPAGSRVSGALRAIVLRGLSVRPGDRFPTMDHLLAELGRDRARPWRWTAIIAAAVGAALALGLFADLVVRDRVAAEIRESFALTGRQTNRAWDGLTARFDTGANQVYSLSVMREVSSNRDQADFGLGTATADADNLERIHSALASQDWTLAQDFAGMQYPMTIAVADYKGRMLFSTAAPSHGRSDLMQLPWVVSALTQKDRSITLVRTDEPALARAGLLGPTPPPGLDFIYTRTLVLGNDRTKEVGGAFIEAVDAARLFGEIRLDQRTRLSIVADDGTAIGDVPVALVRLAAARDGIASAAVDGGMFQVLAQPIRGFDNQVVGKVVMARQLDSVLVSLFPGARLVFELALVGAILVAIGAALRMRQITRA
ncbi:MAG TPA: serine/threonine-protein kinase [Kofleriaceae bacterium]|nr:serine/threonine-protein kinase [Kofleriaceae bacterium]